MLPFNFDYYKPATIEEALQVYSLLHAQNKKPIYFAGGTEILTLGRLNLITTDAVIDIKAIPECNINQQYEKRLILGSAVSLTEIEETNLFPLLSATVKEIADRTARNKITVGGNICGNIYYREAVLPLLLTSCEVVIAGPAGIRILPIQQIFNQHLHLAAGEFLVQIMIDEQDLHLPYVSIKRRRQWETGYPLLTAAAIRKGGQVNVAFSALLPYPFRSSLFEEKLNQKGLLIEKRIRNAIETLHGPILNDVEGSAEYRRFVLQNIMIDIMEQLEGEQNG